VKLATFNINGVNNRLENLLEWLARDQPDVVCLQELKATDKQFPAKALRDAGYHALWHGEHLWNGVAILSREAPPVLTRRGLPGFADEHARYLEAAVGGVLVGALYLPNGNPIKGPKFTYKLEWFEALIAHAAALFASDHPVVLAGDFNVVPTDEDIYDPKHWMRDALLQPESRECYRRLLAQGWVDSLRELHSDERIYTFWDYFRNHWKRNAGLRIDHVLLSKQLAPQLKAAGVATWVRDRPHASDHAPTWIELAAKAKAPKAPNAPNEKAKTKPKPKPTTAARSAKPKPPPKRPARR
jgi:exodeoxyribonuclease-3